MPNNVLRVLILEDSKSDAMLLLREIERGGYIVEHQLIQAADELEVALEAEWDVILSDYSMPSFEAPEALTIVREQKKLDIPFIIVSGTINEDTAVEAMKAGASDYFTKQKIQRLVPAIERELREVTNRRKQREAELEIRKAEERFLKAFQSSPVGIAISRLSDGVTLAVNNKFIAISGYEESAMLGKRGNELDLWIDPAQRIQIADRLRNADPVRNVEAGLRRPSGEEIHTLLSAELIELDNELCILTFVQDVTELKQRQLEVLETKILLEKTFASLSEAVLIIEPENRSILMCNTAVESVLGYRPDELIGQTTEFLHVNHEMFEKFGETGEPVLKRENTFRTEYQMRHKDGHIIWTENTVTTLHDESGFQGGVVSVIRDITQSKESQEQIKRSTERIKLLRDIATAANETDDYAVFLQNAIDTICTYTQWDIGHVYLSPGIHNDQTLRSTSLWYFSNATDFDSFRQQTQDSYEAIHTGLIQEVADTRQARWIEDVGNHPSFVRAEGAKQCGLHGGYFIPIISANTIAGVLEFYSQQLPSVFDKEMLEVAIQIGSQAGRVIERTRAQAILKESDERYEALFERSLDAVYVHDLNGNFLDANPATLELLGFDKEDIPTISFPSLLMPEDLALAIQELQQTIRQGFQEQISEYALRGKNANMVYVEILSSVIYREGIPWAIQGIARDITNRKATEQALQRYVKRLELMHEIDRAILATEQSPMIAQSVLYRLKSLVPFLGGSVVIFDNDYTSVTYLAIETVGKSIRNIGDAIPIENYPGLEFLKRNEPYIVDDIKDLKEYATLAERQLMANGMSSCIVIPIISQNILRGAINLHSDKPNNFSAEAVEITTEVASQIAIALENARLLETERKRNAELMALHQAGLQLAGSLDVDTVLNTILDYAILLIAADNAHIFLYDGENLSLGSAFWAGKRQSKPIVEPRPDGLTYKVARTSQRIIVPNVNQDPIFGDWKWRDHINAVIGLPLIIADQVNGVMVLTFLSSHQFNEEEIRALELLADMAAIAIQNAQLYKKIQQHADQLEQKVQQRTIELQHAKERAEAIFVSTSDAVILLDEQGNVTQANPAFKDQFRHETEPLNQNTLSTLFKDPPWETVLNAVQKTNDSGEAVRLDVVCARQDGTHFEAELAIAPVIDHDQFSASVVCTLHDISQRKLIEASLRGALANEKELNELKSRFTSMISHEFRGPLTVILSAVGMLTTYADKFTEEKKNAKMADIGTQVQRLVQMLDDILSLSRAENVAMTFKPELVNLTDLCQEIVTEFKQIAPSHKLTITVVGDTRRVSLDVGLIRDSVRNLLSNAIKYSPDGGSVEITINYAPHQVVLQVKDNGLGIPQEDLPKLFEAFHRAKNVGNISGTGLGLAIVERAINAHQGAITIDSTVGSGTTFTISIPTD